MKKQKNEFKVVLISLCVIIVVVGLMFLKINSKEKKVEEKNILENQKVIEKIKSAKSISAENLSQRIKDKEKMTIIDIRSAAEFKKKHIIGSINVSPEKIRENIDKIEKNLTYVLIDNTDTIEVMNLVSSDFSNNEIVNTYYLTGGLNNWIEDFNSAISEGDPNSAVDQSKISYINISELKLLIEEKKNILIIDVREEKSFKAERIPGAINIALDDLEKRIDEIPIGKKIVVYDDEALSAFKAAVRLFDLGKINTSTLSEGFIAWKGGGNPTEK